MDKSVRIALIVVLTGVVVGFALVWLYLLGTKPNGFLD
jgi:hypothetical protein